jgi:C4-dicarboxylate-specific signal transduction histidine kinase
MGKSLYKITSGPTSIEFKAQDVDRYTFTVEIKYATVVEQSIQIAVFSANLAPEGIQFNVKGSKVRLEFTLTVTEEPKYPSAQDVAQAVVQQVANELAEFRMQTDKTLETLTQNVATQWVLVGFTAAVSLAFLFVLVHWVWPILRRLSREEPEASEGLQAKVTEEAAKNERA